MSNKLYSTHKWHNFW